MLRPEPDCSPVHVPVEVGESVKPPMESDPACTVNDCKDLLPSNPSVPDLFTRRFSVELAGNSIAVVVILLAPEYNNVDVVVR